jgi:hypothetical protein
VQGEYYSRGNNSVCGGLTPSYTELFPFTVGHNVNLNKLQAVLIVLLKKNTFLPYLPYFSYIFTIFYCIFQIFSCEMIWKIWKKGKLKCEMIWKIWKKGKSNNEKIWKIQ